MSVPPRPKAALLTLGCARNEVDSEELAAKLASGGWEVTTDGTDAPVVVVNTCGFITKAKQDSIDTLLAAVETGAKVVATGCMAERYGNQLEDLIPELAGVMGFDHYPDLADQLKILVDGGRIAAHTPRDRRLDPPVPAPDQPLETDRYRLDSAPAAPLKIASGCDRRCAFCAIPAFRGSFVSRPPEQILAQARQLVAQGVRELVLVSENSTSYGKDLGDSRLLESLLAELSEIPDLLRIRVTYLQPAEIRPALVTAIAKLPKVAAYFDLSFQHASQTVLRRMRRFGGTQNFLDLIETIRELAPEAGIRSNFIVGFPGETRADVAELESFLTAARLDAVGVFDYSDEEGTEAATLPNKVSAATIKRRYGKLSWLTEQLCSQRAAERIGSWVEVLVDEIDQDGVRGRAAHQAPEVDGLTSLVAAPPPDTPVVIDASLLDQTLDGFTRLDPVDQRPGDLVRALVVGSDGVDLYAVPVGVPAGVSGPGGPAGLARELR